jgi:hypothetical protein
MPSARPIDITERTTRFIHTGVLLLTLFTAVLVVLLLPSGDSPPRAEDQYQLEVMEQVSDSTLGVAVDKIISLYPLGGPLLRLHFVPPVFHDNPICKILPRSKRQIPIGYEFAAAHEFKPDAQIVINRPTRKAQKKPQKTVADHLGVLVGRLTATSPPKIEPEVIPPPAAYTAPVPDVQQIVINSVKHDLNARFNPCYTGGGWTVTFFGGPIYLIWVSYALLAGVMLFSVFSGGEAGILIHASLIVAILLMGFTLLFLPFLITEIIVRVMSFVRTRRNSS